MRLKKLDVRGFGRLEGTFPLEMGQGSVALLLERNEAGKTTLSAAVLAALFGLPGDRRRKGRLTQKEHYRPWGGGDFGVALHLTVGNEDLVIDRDFESDAVRVLSGGKDVSDRYRKSAIDALVAAGDKDSIYQLRVIAAAPNSSRGLQEAAKRAVNKLSGRKVFDIR